MNEIELGVFNLQEISRGFYLAIPKKWILSNELSKGSKLKVVLDSQKNLLIKPVREVEE